MSRRRRTGRVTVDFAIIEKFATAAAADLSIGELADNLTLSRKSSLHRCKNGSFTLCLIWRSSDGLQISSTYRGLQLEAA